MIPPSKSHLLDEFGPPTRAARPVRRGVAAAVLPRVERWLGLADGEGGRAARLLGLVFVMSAALVLLKAAQSGIFLVAYPRSTIPWAFAASAVALASLSLLSVPMAARFGPVRLASFTLATAAASLLLLRATLWAGLPHAPFALYVLVEAICGLLLIQVWSVVSEATNARSAKRLLPIAGVGATLAWTVVGLLVPGVAHALGAPGLLLLAPGLLLGCLWLVRAVNRHDLTGESAVMTRKAPMIQEWQEGFAFVRGVPLMRVMTVLSVLSLVSEQLMDFQMMAVAREKYGAPAAVASFFGAYYGLTSAVSLLLLLGLSGRALARLGASRSLLSVPAATMIGAGLAAAVPGFWPVVVMRAADRVLKQSLWSSASEQTQTPLPVLRRAQARALIRGVIAPAGYAVAALGLAALPEQLDLRWLALATAVVCGAMAALIFLEVRRAYQRALQQAVEDRKLDLGEGSATPLDADACMALAAELRSADPLRAALAAELLHGSATALATDALIAALEHPATPVRMLAIEGLEKRNEARAAGPLCALIRGDADDAARVASLRALRRLGLRHPDALAAAEAALDAPDPRVVAAARVTSAALRNPDAFASGLPLLPLLDDPLTRAEALAALAPACVAEIGVLAKLIQLLRAGDLPQRKEALKTVARLRPPSLLPEVLKLLDEPDLSADATASLTDWGGDALAPLGSAIGAPATDTPPQDMIMTLAPGASAGQAIFQRLLSHGDSAVRERAARALSHVVRGGKRPPLGRDVVAPLLDREIAGAYRLSCILGGLAHDDGVPDWELEPEFAFLGGEVERRILAIRGRALHLLALMGNSRLVRGVEFGLRRNSASVDAKIAELLELVLDPQLARKIVPLFDRLSLRERAEIARRLGIFDEEAMNDPLAAIVATNDPHLLGCAMITYGQRFAERFPQVYEREAALLPLFERMTFLRSVPLFGELSGEDLRSVADIVELVDYAAGAVVFRKGDPGEDMYLIVRGRVAVRDGKVELNSMGEREFFGELAVLDREPRSADIVCLQDTRLLRLRAGDLGELMARRPQICQHIMLVLVRRLRSLTQRVATLRRRRRPALSEPGAPGRPRPGRSRV